MRQLDRVLRVKQVSGQRKWRVCPAVCLCRSWTKQQHVRLHACFALWVRQTVQRRLDTRLGVAAGSAAAESTVALHRQDRDCLLRNMNMDRRGRIAAVVAAPLILTGCFVLYSIDDFSSASEVAVLDLRKEYLVSKSYSLRRGNVSFSFVIDGYDCKSPLDAVVNITVYKSGSTTLKHGFRVGDLTWLGGTQDCQPVGYLRARDWSRPLSFSVDDSQENPIGFDFEVKPGAEGVAMPLRVWVVYNNRTPIERMLRNKQ
jgi:hypothetical protein